MKIFGLEINRTKKPKVNVVQDQTPEVKVIIPQTKKITKIGKIRNPTLNYQSSRNTGRGAFSLSEYDLTEIGKIEDTDSYVRQAFNKKVALMLKEGWDLTGPNLKTIKYIKARLAQIAAATDKSTTKLFREIGSAIVKKSNCFLIKVRDEKASGGKIRQEPNKSVPIKPIAGYFVVPAETMEFQLSNSNKITSWRQVMPDGSIKAYPAKDVVHISMDCKEGFVFGTPTLVPVIDDIRALRKIEENLELLVYQYLFPLYQYIVGTPDAPAGITEEGDSEIDVVRQEIQYMPSEGGIVTSERHKIEAIGAEGRALRAEGYVDHFKKRVFAGLGTSAVDFGEGETANRATADNMSRNLVDSVKDIQEVVADGINEYIIKELLLESTFGDDVLDEENLVALVFREIDTDAKIKKENHHADLFAKNIITHDEARRGAGKEPLLLPSPDDVEAGADTAEKFPEWQKTFWKMFEEPKMMIQALDEPYTPMAKAVANNPSTGVSQGDVDKAGKEQEAKEITLEKEKAKLKPKPAPKKTVKNAVLAQTYSQVKEDIANHVLEAEVTNPEWIAAIIRAAMSSTVQKVQDLQFSNYRSWYQKYARVDGEAFVNQASLARVLFRDRTEKYVYRLTETTIRAVKRQMDANPTMTRQDLANLVRAAFDSLDYRATFIENVEITKAGFKGILDGLRTTNPETLLRIVRSGGDACVLCDTMKDQVFNVLSLDYTDLPPYHASCGCSFSVEEVE